MPDHEKSPVEQLVDALVYAPIGLALAFRDSLPTFVEKGRQRVESETTTARVMGQYAVRQAAKENRKRFERLLETLVALGVVPGNDTSTPPAATPAASAPAPSPERGGASVPTPESSNGQAASNGPARPEGSSLAIPGYDTLSASQVVQRLAGLADDELEAVRAYEEATRGRRTILSKVAQLQSSS
jgi:hypothetical protein